MLLFGCGGGEALGDVRADHVARRFGGFHSEFEASLWSQSAPGLDHHSSGLGRSVGREGHGGSVPRAEPPSQAPGSGVLGGACTLPRVISSSSDIAPGELAVVRGRHEMFFAGQPCGDERWAVESGAQGERANGVQVTRAPHPFPGRIEWSAGTDAAGRLHALEVRWEVGGHVVHTRHVAEGTRWRVQLEYGGSSRTQEGDYPAQAHIVFGSPVLQSFVLRRFVLAPGADHEFPALVVGPPWMTVEPGHQRLRCTAAEVRETVLGPRELRRIEWHDPAVPDADVLTLWVDDDDTVFELWEGAGAVTPSSRLTEFARA